MLTISAKKSLGTHLIIPQNDNRRLNDDLYYCISELRDGTYSSLSETRESRNSIKMLTLSVFEG